LGYVGVGLVGWVGVRLAIFAKMGVGLLRFRVQSGLVRLSWFAEVKLVYRVRLSLDCGKVGLSWSAEV
jgi:hypothetical protein